MRSTFHRAGASVLGVVLIGVALAGSAGSALGQSFLQQLFGFGGPPSRPPPQRLGSPPVSDQSSAPAQSRRHHGDDRDDDGAHAGRKYRTMCVRACDGYYFPISNAASHRQFQHDVRSCEASCGSEARLFYMPAGEDSDVATMTDLTGLAYSATPNAFKYRKALVSGCSCKPMPWSDAERARHRQYAAVEAVKRGETPPAAPLVAEREQRPADLPPPVSGPGVMVISATGVATYSDTHPRAAARLDADDEAGEPLAPTVAATSAPQEAVARVRSRPRFVVINAAQPHAARPSRVVSVNPAPGGLFGTGLFAPEPRRIVVKARHRRPRT